MASSSSTTVTRRTRQGVTKTIVRKRGRMPPPTKTIHFQLTAYIDGKATPITWLDSADRAKIPEITIVLKNPVVQQIYTSYGNLYVESDAPVQLESAVATYGNIIAAEVNSPSVRIDNGNIFANTITGDVSIRKKPHEGDEQPVFTEARKRANLLFLQSNGLCMDTPDPYAPTIIEDTDGGDTPPTPKRQRSIHVRFGTCAEDGDILVSDTAPQPPALKPKPVYIVDPLFPEGGVKFTPPAQPRLTTLLPPPPSIPPMAPPTGWIGMPKPNAMVSTLQNAYRPPLAM